MKNFLLFSTLCFTLFCSCLSSSKHIQGSFKGLREQILDTSSLAKDTRIMVLHGVGIKEMSYADTFINKFMIELSGKRANRFNNQQFLPIESDLVIPLKQGKAGTIIVRKYKIKEETIRFFIVNWTAVTLPYKKYLFENHDYLLDAHKPARINRNQKRNVMLKNLSDLIYYTGELRKEIRYPVQKCMQLMFMSEADIKKFQVEHIPDDTIAIQRLYDKSRTDRDVFLFPFSMGSKITMDILSKDKLGGNEYVCDDQLCSFFSKNLRGIYMMSHQIPLLSSLYMGRDGLPQGVNNEDEYYLYQNYYGVCNFLMNNPNSQPMDLVAFNDPNDFLGYVYIKEPPFCKCQDDVNPENCDSDKAEERINKVVYSIHNTKHFLRLVAHPGKAHEDTYINNRLIKMLCRGVDDKGKRVKFKEFDFDKQTVRQKK